MKTMQSWALLALSLCAFAIVAAEPDAGPSGSVNDLMLTVITPATNTIWGIEDPQTDEEWQVFVDAAAQVIDAAQRIKNGGSGPNDSAWAEDPEWQRAYRESVRDGPIVDNIESVFLEATDYSQMR
ncbi:MAG: hypothetical protein IH912_03425 [Proteobacteria bacterium]|nr:hypothetical protein [Pseudomonadota bacterium]